MLKITTERRRTEDLIGMLREHLKQNHAERNLDENNDLSEKMIEELRSLASLILQDAGIIDPGVTADELKQWNQALHELCKTLSITGSKHLIGLIEIYAELKAAEEKTRLRNMNIYMKRGK